MVKIGWGEVRDLEKTLSALRAHRLRSLSSPTRRHAKLRVSSTTRRGRLLDEYRICTSPVIKGGGEPLFRPASAGTLELLDTKTFGTGACIHVYGPTSHTPASESKGDEHAV